MRRHDLLIAYQEEVRFKPFAWGAWDCCQFTAEWVHRVTGSDPRGMFPAYSSEAEAREVLAAAGGLLALVDKVAPRVHVSRAREGDLILANEDAGAALGICCGFYSAHVGPQGLTYFPAQTGLAAWRIE